MCVLGAGAIQSVTATASGIREATRQATANRHPRTVAKHGDRRCERGARLTRAFCASSGTSLVVVGQEIHRGPWALHPEGQAGATAILQPCLWTIRRAPLLLS